MNDIIEFDHCLLLQDNKDGKPNALSRSLKSGYNAVISKLFAVPAFIELVKASFPETILIADFSEKQKEMIKEGLITLSKDRDGKILAILRGNGKIHSQVRLEELSRTPDLSGAINNFIVQQQMARIIDLVCQIQDAILELTGSLQDDRIALCNSAHVQLLNSRVLQKPELRFHSYALAVKSAEDSRQMLMLSLQRDIKLLHSQPKTKLKMFFSSDNGKQIASKLCEIERGFCYLTKATLIEASAYFDLNETEAMTHCVGAYLTFVDDNFDSKTLLMLNSNSGSSKLNYWVDEVPKMKCKLESLASKLENDIAQITVDENRIETLLTMS